MQYISQRSEQVLLMCLSRYPRCEDVSPTSAYLFILFIYLLYMKPMHNELKTLTNVTK